MELKTRRAVTRLVFDIVCIACVAIPVLIVFVVAKPYKRGFYCDDESLMHPYKDNTIPTWVAGFVGIALPSLAILGLEFIHSRSNQRKIHQYFVECYKLFMPFFFGAGISQLTTDIAKYTVGRLRPHFITVCKPTVTCTLTTGFIEGDDACSGTDTAAIEEARLSFPSGHSSIGFYCMIWLIIYLQFRFTWKRYWLVRPGLQVVAFYLAYYTALSRISDYMHHWSDVLSGAIIGTVIALLNIFFMSNLLPGKRKICQCCTNGLHMHTTLSKTPTIDSDRHDV